MCTSTTNEPLVIRLELTCNEEVDTLTEIDSEDSMCLTVKKYETSAGCTFWTFRPFNDLMERLSILNGTVLIIIGGLNLFFGKVAAEHTL